MAEKTVAVPETQEQEVPAKEGTRAREHYITPPVDIYETAEGLVVMADLPGVEEKNLDIRVENKVLTLLGRSGHALPSDSRTYQEYELVHFFRQFELTDKVDISKITATLKHGVLTLSLPKAEEVKPRKIDVQLGE